MRKFRASILMEPFWDLKIDNIMYVDMCTVPSEYIYTLQAACYLLPNFTCLLGLRNPADK